MATLDFYAVLELSPTATEEDVRRAYRRLAVRWHPDKNPEDVMTAEQRFKEVSEAYEVLRDPTKRRQYDRLREGPARARRTRSWFDNPDGFGDDLWSEPEWGGSRPSWAFRNPFDVFREFFGQRDPWADMTPRSRRQPAAPSQGPSSSFWSMGGDPFSSRPFSSPFFASTGNLFSQLLDQRRSATPDRVAAPASPTPSTTRVEIKIGGFSDSEDTSSGDEEEVLQEGGEGEAQVVEEEEEEEEESIDVDDVALREAIRLSLAQEQERKRYEEQEAAQTEEELQEAIRRSLADLEKQRTVPTSGDWMDEEDQEEEDDEYEEPLQRGRRLPQQQQQRNSRQGLSAFH